LVPCAETLSGRDQQICSSLEEKLQLYAELTELTLHSPPQAAPQRHLLVRPDTDGETPPRQTSALLAAALQEGEREVERARGREVA